MHYSIGIKQFLILFFIQCSDIPRFLALSEFQRDVHKRDVRESVHRDTTMKGTNKMQLYRFIDYSYSALYVSGDVFAHHQEHLTVITVSGSVHPSGYRLVPWLSFSSNIKVNLLFQVSSTCFGRCFRSSSGTLDCNYSIW